MITVVKLDHQGIEKTRYAADIRTRLANGVILDAYWQRPGLDLGYTLFEPGDHFVEYFYTNRWFNIFSITSALGQHKGWYCNIAMPAHIDAQHIEQVDLLLDLWVRPDGETLILDEDEFAAAQLTEAQRSGAHQGLLELLDLIHAHHAPFETLA